MWLEIFYLVIYVIILILTIILLKRSSAYKEAVGRDLTEIFLRDILNFSVSTRLKMIYIQFKMFLFKIFSLIIIIIIILTGLSIATWHLSSELQASFYKNTGSIDKIIVIEGDIKDLDIHKIGTPVLFLYSIYLEKPIVIRYGPDQKNMIVSNDLIIIRCLNEQTILRNMFLKEICSSNNVTILGRDIQGSGDLYYEDNILRINISSQMYIKDPDLINKIYTLNDLFEYRSYEIMGFYFTPKILVILNSENLFTKDLLNKTSEEPIKAILYLNRDISENFLIDWIKKSYESEKIIKAVIALNDKIIVYKVSYTSFIYQLLQHIFLTIVFISSVFILYIKIYEESFVKYLESTLYSGGTDWISRRSLLIIFPLYGLFIISLSSLSSYLINVIRKIPDITNISISLSILFGGILGIIISTIYLWRVLSEKSIYHVEKLPAKVYSTYIFERIEPMKTLDDMIRVFEKDEFFGILEAHRSYLKDVYRLLLRLIYSKTMGIGIDLYITLEKDLGERYKLSIYMEPWSAEDLPPEVLTSVSRLLISRLEGFVKTVIMRV
ncbi:MAG: hypothetical protein LM586_01025 [Desulfurococcales archaeon]|nr:hypothetical protein [Desulfurococcales archaeon]